MHDPSRATEQQAQDGASMTRFSVEVRLATATLALLFVVLALIIYGESLRAGYERHVLALGPWPITLKWLDWVHMREGGGVLALVTALLLVLLLVVERTLSQRRAGRPLRLTIATLALTTMFASGVLTVGSLATIRPHFFDIRDQFLYHLGTRYFDEAGYGKLNHCLIEAAHDAGWKVPRATRDLDTNRMIPTQEVLEKALCRKRFTDERWRALQSDMVVFHEGLTSWGNSWEALLHDHGFNGTPVLRRVIATSTSFFETTHASLTRLGFLNLIVVFIALFSVLFWVGWRECVACAVILFAYPGDGFIHIASIPRYFWFASMLVGVSALHRGHFALAGAALTFSASLKIFPVLWLAGPLVLFAAALLHRWRSVPWLIGQRVPGLASLTRFVVAASATGIVLFVWSIVDAHGLGNWTEFLAQMKLNGTRLAAGCIGFKYDFLRPLMEREGGAGPSLRRLASPIVFGITLHHIQTAIQLLLAALVLRRCARLPPAEAAVLGGFGLLFIFLGPVRYYYAGFLGLPLLFTYKRSPVLFTVASVALLFMAGVSGLRFEHVFESHIFNGFLSVGFTFFLVGALVAFEFTERRAVRRARDAQRPPEHTRQGLDAASSDA
jgi:hypothetical protein